MMKILKTLLNVGFAIMFVGGNVKVGDICHITGKYTGSAHRDCNFKVKLNNKTQVLFHKLENITHILLRKNQPNLILKQMSWQMDDEL